MNAHILDCICINTFFIKKQHAIFYCHIFLFKKIKKQTKLKQKTAKKFDKKEFYEFACC